MVQLVVLDVNETLRSLSPIADRFEEIGLDGRFELWFTRILRDGFAASAAGSEVAFVDLARDHLVAMLEQGGVEASGDLVDGTLETFRQLPAHGDVEPGLRAIRNAGMTAVTLTVGSAAITESFLEREGLTELVAGIHDAQEAGHWKPRAAAYRYVLDTYNVEAGDAALIASHPWDVMGAQQAGLIGAWLDRSNGRYPASYPTPTITASTLPGLVDQLRSASGGS